jgi:glycosyltransferase involved in cell wall biosynthesis
MNRLSALRVGFVVPSFDKGGLERVALELYRACSRRGISATVFSQSGAFGALADEVDPADLVAVCNRHDNFFAEATARRITTLHYNYSTFQLREATEAGIRTIYTIHNYYTWLDDRSFAARAEIIRAASAVVAVSEGVKRYFEKRANWDGGRVQVILNGARFSGQFSTLAPITPKRGDRPHVFANVASFYRAKHHALLIRAAEILHQRGLEFSLLLIGGKGDERYEAEIEARLRKTPAKDCIQKLGFRPHEELERILRDEVDTVVMASIQEGGPIAALEALALGKRVILTDTGAARDMAVRMPHLVTVIPCAQDIETLDANAIERLSRNGDCRNLAPLVDAMAARIAAGPPSAPPPDTRFPFDMETFEEGHLRLIEGAG